MPGFGSSQLPRFPPGVDGARAAATRSGDSGPSERWAHVCAALLKLEQLRGGADVTTDIHRPSEM